MARDSGEVIQELIAALSPLVAKAAGEGERVGHLLLVLGAGRFCAEAGRDDAAEALREFATMVERGQVQDPFTGI
jgi:hypothetical protein